ncbi:MAG: class I tRNA ligase family protein [Candidatus Competibacteraceae bacterium]|nr:class I tRNA ligase family protein [Candidatus Competibacteraceae bacterium]
MPSLPDLPSDLEVEHEETKGHLYCIKYKSKDGADGLVVATTRPETLSVMWLWLFIPKTTATKLTSAVGAPAPHKQRIPVIADSYVERDFGTGCLKITPAHDANDFEVGQRHNLDRPVVIDQHGKLNNSDFVPTFLQGKERFAARKEVVQALEEAGQW